MSTKESKFTWSETFLSIEGEGPHSGHGTIYSRFALCNFKCKGFNNPENLDTTQVSVLGFDPKDYKRLQDIPLITRGCDSIYSWDPKFKHMWKTGTATEHIQELLDQMPGKSFINPVSGKPMIWSITGGEPTLHWKKLPELFNHPLAKDCKHILIETNCTVPFKWEFVMAISQWLSQDPERRWTWSNSPKLSASGEKWEDAIKPDVAAMQRLATGPKSFSSQTDQYFKFVCDDTDQSFDEVAKAMQEYHDAGIPKDTPIYVMPVACQESDQDNIASNVAMKCIERGYIYCHRVHLSVFGNTVGT